MNLGYTRAMIQSALSGELAKTETAKHDIFGLEVPLHVPGVPDEVLMPEQTWADKAAYKAKAIELANEFKANFKSSTAYLKILLT